MNMRRRLCSAVYVIWASWSVIGADVEQLLAEHRAQPNDWKLCQQIGIAYVQQQQLEKALEFFDKAARLNPQFLPARKNRATVLWFLDRKKESEQEFLKLLPSMPNDGTVHFYLGLASHRRHQFVAAKNHFAKAGPLAIENPEALPAVVESFLKTRDYSVISRALDTLHKNEANRAQMLEVAELLIDNGRDNEAISLLEPFATRDGDAAALLARAYEHQQQNDKAYSMAVKAIELSPTERNYLSLSLFAAEHKNLGFALDVIRRGLKQNPNSPILLMNEGLLLAISGSRTSAEERLRQASEAKPDWSDPLLALGILQLEASSSDKAVETFNRAINLNPRDARAYFLLATALSRMGDANRTQVIAALSQATSLSPKDARPYVLLGQTHVSAGKLGAALAAFEKAHHLDPKNSAAVYQLALLCRRQGKTQLAAKYMEQFRDLKARNEEGESELVQVLKILKE